MAIDTSMYGAVQAPQINIPSPLSIAQQQQSLASLGLQNMQTMQAIRTQGAMRQAFANNVDENGNLNQQGFLADLGRVNPMAAMEYGKQFNEMAKSQADLQNARLEAANKTLSITGPTFENLNTMTPDQRAQAWPQTLKNLQSQGVDISRMNHPYDENMFQQYYNTWRQSKPSLENQAAQANIINTQTNTQKSQGEIAQQPQQLKNLQLQGQKLAAENAQMPLEAKLKQSEINKNNNENMKTGAEELGKFNEDINNASSRKSTGSLIDSRNRADRILSLLKPLPGETPQQTTARLNSYMPQVGTEIGTSLAAIMQGGVPNEELQKELSPDTIQSKIASLRQKFSSEPTGANQAELLKGYGDIAQKLRDFSQSRLQEVTTRARAAYPYANKYYSKQMDQISAPITSPGATSTYSGAPSGTTQGGNQAPGAPSSTSSSISPPKPGDVRRGYVFNGGDPTNKNNWKLVK